jgi:hypothetical protein
MAILCLTYDQVIEARNLALEASDSEAGGGTANDSHRNALHVAVKRPL